MDIHRYTWISAQISPNAHENYIFLPKPLHQPIKSYLQTYELSSFSLFNSHAL